MSRLLKIRPRDFNLKPEKDINPDPVQVEVQDNNSDIVKRLDDMALSIAQITKFVEDQS